MTPRVLVVGADAAGMTAASAIRKLLDRDAAEIVALDAGQWTSYSACGIPYWVAGDVGSPDDLIARTPEEHRNRGIDVRLGHRVERIDLDRRTALVHHGLGESYEIGWDRLLVATGAQEVRPPVPGWDGLGIHAVKSIDDGRALLDELAAGAQRAVVAGSGFIGIEMAEACVTRGLATTVVERGDRPARFLDPAIGTTVEAEFRERGIEVLTGTVIESFELDDRGHVRAVVTTAGRVEADLVVIGLGIVPRSELVAEVELGDKGGIVVDEHQRVPGRDDVWAAGDCVVTLDRLTGRRIHLPLGTHANKQGLVAGESIAASLGADVTPRAFDGAVRTAITKLFDLELARTGLGEEAAREAGFDPVVAVIQTTTTAGYWPAAAPMQVLGVADRASRRLLGVQIAGGPGAGVRIDIAAMALWTEMTVDELVMTDLSYAPPFSSVWSPVQVVARALVSALGR